MRSFRVLVLMIAVLLSATWVARADVAAQQNPPQITAFTTTATSVTRAALVNKTARIPVTWASINRPNTANLVFEQVMPGGQLVNIELPRQNPFVSSEGNGVVAPLSPGDTVNEIRLRVTLVDVIQVKPLDQREIVLPITTAPPPVIRAFSSNAANVSRNDLNNRTARVPVSWQVESRPENSNLVFEQVLDNNTTVNVELPRSVPIVPSAGVGTAAPVAPGGSGTTIVLRLRVINLGDNSTLAQQDISLPIVDTPAAQPVIALFSTTATSVSRASLNDKSARVPVAWAVANRPANSNLVFEQVLDSGSVVNVELPRSNPFVASEGNGVAAPVPPGGSATSIKLQVRLIDLGNGAELAKQQLNLPISETSAAPVIRSFTTTAANVNRTGLTGKTERVPVDWAVDNRPPNSNLVFEQVLADNSVVNVELPRSNPIVPSAGHGTAAPVAPGGNATSITLQLRLVDLGNQATLAQQRLTLPIIEPAALVIRSFTSTLNNVSRISLKDKSARVPVSWLVDNRPPNSNLVFEQVLPDNSFVNVELPRSNPIVPSSGNGVAAPIEPAGNTTSITLRLRLIDLTTQATLAQQTLTLPIVENASGASITTFAALANTVDFASLANRTARVTVSWQVDNRPANSNLVFEQVHDDGSVLNVELPRSNPIIASSGNGVVAPTAPGGIVMSSTIRLRLRLVNLASNTTLVQSEVLLPIGGNITPFVQIVDAAQCYSNGFAPGNGLLVASRAQISSQVGTNGLPAYDAGRNGQTLGSFQAGEFVTVTDGPFCFRYLYASNWVQLVWRNWRVKSETRALEGWVAEYESPPGAQTRVNLAPAGAASQSGNTAPESIAITSFTVTPSPASRQGEVTFAWQTSGPVTKVTISRLSVGDGTLRLILDSQPASGSTTYTLPEEYINEAQFSISAFDASGRETVQGATIALTCPFATSLAEDCPVTQATNVASAYQSFEQGQMIWRGDTRKIYVLYSNGSWAEFDDTWVESDGATPGDNAPEGLLKPERGFGKVWTQVGGLNALGWATTAESSYNATWETHQLADGNQVVNTPHFTLPDGTAVHMGIIWTMG